MSTTLKQHWRKKYTESRNYLQSNGNISHHEKRAVEGEKVILAVPGAPGQEPALDDWDTDYAKPRNTNAMRAQGPTIARLEAENAALGASSGMQTGAIARLEAENAALKLNNKVTISGATETRMSFHPEFLAFMRETFAREVMQSCNAQRVATETAAAETRLQIAALKAEISHHLDNHNSKIDMHAADTSPPVAQEQGRRARAGTPQHNDVLRVLETTTRELEHMAKKLQAKVNRIIIARRRRCPLAMQEPPPRFEFVFMLPPL
ncbi:hypothetical protein DFH08DRAFT_242295 [Mycena albidolilacea]|uniref:Uncharacterized protein n=1 Tax=Mycena albidolilacea TaxID=1033008 RepID=A0AAD6ZX73_9AGAR|nr:hypothetical protein DFH08DRAFT_242295 [Mycena albidolilacea]